MKKLRKMKKQSIEKKKKQYKEINCPLCQGHFELV